MTATAHKPDTFSKTKYASSQTPDVPMSLTNGHEPPSHDGPCTRSFDPDGKPLHYCATCFQDMPTCSRCWRPLDGPGAQTCNRPHASGSYPLLPKEGA